MHLIDSIGLKSQTKLYYLRLCATPTSMLMHTLRSLPSSVSQEGMQAAHDRLKPVVARAFSQPETIFDDHKDTKLEERVFNRRLEGGCGITKITTIAAVAHAARLLDVLPRTVKLPWQTTNETQVDDWRNSQSASLREAHATLLGLSAASNQQTLHEAGEAAASVGPRPTAELCAQSSSKQLRVSRPSNTSFSSAPVLTDGAST